MASLEDLLREIAKRGELVSLSLLATDKGFSAVYTAASTLGGHAMALDADPVRAMMVALQETPKKQRRYSKEAVTAEVNETAEEPKTEKPVKPGKLSNYM